MPCNTSGFVFTYHEQYVATCNKKISTLELLNLFCFVFISESSYFVITETVLFFGCRNKNEDFFFEKQWKSLVRDGKLKLFTAFSRDQVFKL